MMNDSRRNWIYMRYSCLNILMKFLGHWDRVKVHAHEKSLKHICIDQSLIFDHKLLGIFSKIKT